MTFKHLSRAFKKSSDKGKSASVSSSSSTAFAQPSPIFSYDHLDTTVDSIRLLVLSRQGGHQEKEVRCSLIHSTFAEKPSYEALSYTWGDPATPHHIVLNGKKIAVRENLYWALRALRSLSRDRVLWIDALCIDQTNPEERTYQVGLMDYIYTRASCVIIWLGHLSSVQEMSARSRIVQQRRIMNDSNSPFHSTRDHYLDVWMCTRDYWSRVWIIQEIGLARKLQVCFGMSAAQDWDSFIKDLPPPEVYPQQQALIRTLDDKRKRRNEPSNQLHQLLEAFQYADCTEPRDKIYGFLGLAHDCQNGGFRADYTEPLFGLYTRTTEFFSHKHLNPSRIITELEVCLRIVGFSQLVLKSLESPACSLPRQIASQPHPDQTAYAIAAIAGVILHVGPTFDMLYASSALYKEWKLEFEKYEFSPDKVSELREAYEAYDAFLSQSKNRNAVKAYAICPTYSWSCGLEINASWSFMRSGRMNRFTTKGIHMLGSSNITHDPVSFTEPRLFLASNGYMGLAPPEAQTGDIICQFWNTDVVALLRREALDSVCPPSYPSTLVITDALQEVDKLGEPDKSPQPKCYRVIGRVHLSTGYLNDLKPMYRAWNSPGDNAQIMVIGMDMRTLSALTS